jgi:hypothetical protein
VHEHLEAVTDFTVTKDLVNLISTSYDGCLAVFDLRKAESSKEKLYAMSDNMETDLMAVELVRSEQFVVIIKFTFISQNNFDICSYLYLLVLQFIGRGFVPVQIRLVRRLFGPPHGTPVLD